MYGRLFPTLWARRQQSGTNLRACPSTTERTYRRTRGLVPRGEETLGASPTASPERLAACLAPGEGESRRGGDRQYLEILHFLRPASSATAAATPGAFLFFFTGIFRLPRQGRQGGRGGVSRSAAGPGAPAPARQGPQRRPEARPRPGSPL